MNRVMFRRCRVPSLRFFFLFGDIDARFDVTVSSKRSMFPARVCDRCVGIGTIHSGSTDTIPRSTVMFLCIHQMLFCREDSCPTGDRNCRNHRPYQLYGTSRSLRESRHPSKAPIALRETLPARRPTIQTSSQITG